MDYGAEERHAKSKVLVLVLVLAAIGVLAVVAYIGFTRRGNGGDSGATASTDVAKWCALRAEWAKKEASLEADIILKSVRVADEAERKALSKQRSALCARYAEKVRALTVTDSRIRKVEIALVKEGKVRANVSVEIANALAKASSDSLADVRAAKAELETRITRRIQKGKASADGEISAIMAGIKGCGAIYRGPMTDEGTADDPYVSWRELEIRRKRALAQVEARVKKLEPMEQYANQVYHELVRKYRKTLKKCYGAAKRRKKGLSSEASLLVRLRGNGKIKSMGIAKMEVKDPKLLDCILGKAAKWKLPPPVRSGEHVIINVDFAHL